MYYQSLPLYLNLIRLLTKLYKVVHELPKEYKFTLGQEIISLSWKLIDLFISAQTLSNQQDQKRRIIRQMSLEFDRFKIRIRFLSDLKLISLGQMSDLEKQLDEIGKMIGSWCQKV